MLSHSDATLHCTMFGSYFKPLSSFICFTLRGVNVVPFLEMIGLPESLVGLLRDSSSGYALTAYAMYKVTFLLIDQHQNIHIFLYRLFNLD